MNQDETIGELSDKQAAVLEAAKLQGFNRNISAIAQETGVARSSIWRWFKDPRFKRAWDQIPEEMVSKHMPGIIAAQVQKAIDGDTPAARLIMEYAGKIRQKIDVDMTVEEADSEISNAGDVLQRHGLLRFPSGNGKNGNGAESRAS